MIAGVTIELPALIGSVHAALLNVSNPILRKDEPKPTPAVPVKKSVTPDAILKARDCFERAAIADPTFAPAFSSLALQQFLMAAFGFLLAFAFFLLTF